jgi:teichuronic acid biosynthesis glycosyltransferase TuaG
MENYGLVSVIMPTYNCAPYIVETIRSVQSQTYENWEIIIVDDCSTDNTESIVESINDKRIRYFKNSKNSGAAVSRNFALREAKGRWIAFLDSDDLWAPTKLEHQLRFMVENNYAFSYHNYSEIDEQSKSLG